MEGDDDKYIEYGYPMGRERFKWPSISLAERQGYRYRRPPPSEDDARIQAVRSVPFNLPPSTAEMHVIDQLKRNPLSASTVGGIKSPTSIALKEFYEAVLKGSLSSPASELVQECDEWRQGEEEERTPFLGQVSASGSGVQMTMSGKKRRGHVHHDSSSDDFLWSAAHHGNTAGGSFNSGTKLEVRNPSVGEGRLGLRELDGGEEEEDLVDVELGGRAKKLPEEEDEYTPLPTPTRVAPRSDHPLLVSKDTAGFNVILPEHPKQITSPPLESQILFFPLKGGDMIISPRKSSYYIQPKSGLKPKSPPPREETCSSGRFGHQKQLAFSSSTSSSCT